MSDSQDLQEHTADRLASDRRFVAWYLRQYCTVEQMTTEGVARFLEMNLSDLSRLALCVAPDSNEPDFSSRIQNIATYVGANASQLAQLVRFINFQSKQSTKVIPLANHFTGMLLAAREKETSTRKQEGTVDDNE